MSKTISVCDFLTDYRGRTFRDVVEDPELDFQQLLNFFNDETRQIRMEESEIHHDRPALAGVIRELENTDPFEMFFCDCYSEQSPRTRRAIGVIVCMVMEKRGWKASGQVYSLGHKIRRKDRKNQLQSYHNTSGLSWWFSKSKRFYHPVKSCYPKVKNKGPDILSFQMINLFDSMKHHQID